MSEQPKDDELLKRLDAERRKNAKERKYNPTNRHVFEQTPLHQYINSSSRHWSDGSYTIKPLQLGQPTPSMPWSYDAFEQRLKKFGTNCRIFLDTGFLTSHEIPESFWKALTDKKIFITEGVWNELIAGDTPKINIPFRNRLTQARHKEDIGEGDPCISFAYLDDWPEDIRTAAKQYIGLLGYRKYVAIEQAVQFERQHGRPPSIEELQALCTFLGKRGWRMAYKGYKERDKPRSLTDEELITTAYFHSFLYGSPTLIFTRDNDVFDHFRKLHYLIDTHYRSMLVAAVYATSKRLLTWDMVMNEGTSRYFCGHHNQYVRMPIDIFKRVLPRSLRGAHCGCLLLSTSDSPLMMSAQDVAVADGFEGIVRLRGQLNGLNTDLLGKRNFHIFLPGANSGTTGHCCGIVEDIILTGLNTQLRLLDITLALRTDDAFEIGYTPIK